MAINNPSFSTSDNEANAQMFRLEMLEGAVQPDISREAFIDPPTIPNRLYGWYNGQSDMIELFITNSAGNKYLRVAAYGDE